MNRQQMIEQLKTMIKSHSDLSSLNLSSLSDIDIENLFYELSLEKMKKKLKAKESSPETSSNNSRKRSVI